MGLIASIDIALRGDTTVLDAALSKAQTAVKGFGSALAGMKFGPMAALGGAIGKIAEAFDTVRSRIKKLVDEGMDNLSQLGRSADKLGATTTAIAGLQRLGGMSGLDDEDVTARMARFQRRISSANMGQGTAVLGLRQLELTAQDLMQMPLEEQLGKVADALQRVGNAADKTRLVDSLFGKDANKIMPMLAKGSAGINDAIDKAGSQGMTDMQSVKDIRAVKAGMKEFKASMLGIARTLAVAFAPLMEQINKLVGGVGAEFAVWLKDNVGVLRVIIDLVVDFAKVLIELNVVLISLNAVFGAVSMILDQFGLSFEFTRDGVLRQLFALQFAIGRWKDYATLALMWVGMKVMEFGNTVKHVFTDVIPKSFQILMRLFRDFASGDFEKGLEKAMGSVGKLGTRTLTDEERKRRAQFDELAGKAQVGLDDFVDKKMGAFKDRFDKKDEWKGPGDALFSTAKKPAAMEEGSKEAFSVLSRTETQQQKMFAVANQTLAENKKATALLAKIADKRFGVKKGKL